jgi:hypothetical protein
MWPPLPCDACHFAMVRRLALGRLRVCRTTLLEQVRYWATRLGARYMGEEAAEAFGARNAVPGELLARLTPAKVTSAKDLAD